MQRKLLITGEIVWRREGAELGKTQAYSAQTFWDRLRGLFACAPLMQSQGLVINPCSSIHTFFMGYAIDVVFVDKSNTIVQIASSVVPWRGRFCFRAHYVVELAMGAAVQMNLKQGDTCQCG